MSRDRCRCGATLPSFGLAGATLCLATAASANPFGWHEHDGFYLRVSVGAGLLNLERDTEQEGEGASDLFLGDRSSAGGVVPFTELSVGGTPFARLAIAGTFLSHTLADAELELVDGSSAPLDATLVFTMLAPTVDVFPNPNGGFHFGGGVGLAVVRADVSLTPGGLGGVGGAATVHAGQGFWLDDDWSVGGQLRATLGHVRGTWEAGGFVGHEKDLVTMIGLAVTALYH